MSSEELGDRYARHYEGDLRLRSSEEAHARLEGGSTAGEDVALVALPAELLASAAASSWRRRAGSIRTPSAGS